MGEVLGPFDHLTWITLGLLHRDINHMKCKNRVKYDYAIKQQKEVYDTLLEQAA